MKHILLAGTDNSAVSIREKENLALARRAAAEGIVILRNNRVLPIANKKIALYGSGARLTVKGGTGSGDVHERHSVSIEEGLENAGYQVVTKKWIDGADKHYKKSYAEWKQGREQAVKYILNPIKIISLVEQVPFRFPAGIPIESDDIRLETDTAIYVIARQAGEGTDRYKAKGDWYLENIECENIRRVAESYKHVIVVINAGGILDLSFADEIPNINGLIYFVQGGSEGGNAFADVVTGRVNPSGKLTDTWAGKYEDYPNSATFSHNNGNTTHEDYIEGIYVGYRYFDSFDIKPRFPFGFGLSYTTFEIKTKKVIAEKTEVRISINVRNTGKVAGKEVVQLYVSAPFAAGKEYQRLVAFKKTAEIQPGGDQDLELSFDMTACASYCEESAQYVLDHGGYILRAGNSSRATAAVAVINLDTDVVTEECEHICPKQADFVELAAPKRKKGNLDQVLKINLHRADFITLVNDYSHIPVHHEVRTKEIVDKLTLKELCKLVVGGGITGNRLVNALGAAGTTTSDLFDRHGIPNMLLSDGPAGVNVINKVVLTRKGTVKAVEIPPSFDFGFFRFLMKSMLGSEKDGTLHYLFATAWPVGTLLAQTWDTDLVTEVGQAIGREMQEFGITLWLGPGMNIHRNPLCGRNFEYYSEDPLISGRIGAAVTTGIQSFEGKGTTVKHFACNNQEDNRMYSSSNISERALREIYLKGFEIAVKESQPRALMSSYNLINGVYTPNCPDILIKALRNEWGFKGLVMTDWSSCDPGRGDPAKCPGAGNDLIMPGTSKQSKAIEKAVKSGKVPLEDVKGSAYRIMTVILHNTVCRMSSKQKPS
jgi:beta-glucosidase